MAVHLAIIAHATENGYLHLASGLGNVVYTACALSGAGLAHVDSEETFQGETSRRHRRTQLRC